jgi:hypothetical protein
MSSAIDDILAQKQKATALRNRQRYDAALQILDHAIAQLESMRDASIDERHRAIVDAELADAHGMKGGVHRRRGDMAAALASYRAGTAVEGASSLSTYNLGNVVLLSILSEPARIEDQSLDAEIALLLERLETQTDGSRSDEWWAWADLAQFRLLQGDEAGAKVALNRGQATGPTAAEFQRPLDVLAEVADKLEQGQSARAARILAFIADARRA